MTSVTVEDLDKLVSEIADKEKDIDIIEAELKEKNKAVAELKMQAVGYLKELGREKYAAPFGTVSLTEHWSVKMPTTPENKEQLFNWMREKGIFDSYATVNSNSLKALFKSERDLAVKEGQDPLLFVLPGLEPATVFEGLKFTKAKE